MKSQFTSRLVFTFGEEEVLSLPQINIAYDSNREHGYSVVREDGTECVLVDGTIINDVLYAEQYSNGEIYQELEKGSSYRARIVLERLRQLVSGMEEANMEAMGNVLKPNNPAVLTEEFYDKAINLGECIDLLQKVSHLLLKV